MSLLEEDARELRDIGIETFSPTRGIVCAACFTKTHVPGCPVLSLPKIVAVLEAAERVHEPTIVVETADGHALVYAGCDRRIEQGHAPDCEHQALREALDA